MKEIDNIFSKPLNKKCLLYSSGLDSYIISKLENFDFLLYIDIGSKYAKSELAYIKKQGINVVVDDRLDLSDAEMTNSYVPLRNLFFIMIATLHGASDICVGVLNGDRAQDKDLNFKKLTEDVINYQLEPQWWHPGSTININMKYKKYTKKQLIDLYIEKGFSINDLAEKSFSCYHPVNGKHCGKCKPCVRKWLALLPYKDVSYIYDSNIKDYFIKDVLPDIQERIGTKFSRGLEDEEAIEIYEKYIKDDNE